MVSKKTYCITHACAKESHLSSCTGFHKTLKYIIISKLKIRLGNMTVVKYYLISSNFNLSDLCNKLKKIKKKSQSCLSLQTYNTSKKFSALQHLKLASTQLNLAGHFNPNNNIQPFLYYILLPNNSRATNSQQKDTSFCKKG